MLYSEKFNLLFISVPKTGSSSFTKTFLNILDGKNNVVKSGDEWIKFGTHATLKDVGNLIGWDALSNVTIVGGVRNPWDRMVSSYYFYKNGRAYKRLKSGQRRKPKLILNVMMAKILAFDIWVRFYRKKSCWYYLSDQEGNMGADHIIRLENMVEDVSELCRQRNIPMQKMEHVNRSAHKHYRDYYSHRSRKVIERRFADDIEKFGYKF